LLNSKHFCKQQNQGRGGKSGAQEGTRTPLSYEKRILSHPKVHSPSDNVRLVYSFISDRKPMGLSSNTIKFYEGYLNQFVNTTLVPLLEQNKQGIIDFITFRGCNAGGKHAFFRVLRTFHMVSFRRALRQKSDGQSQGSQGT